jgi:uncharacterized protein
MRKIIVIASIIVAATLGTASPVFAAETLPDAPTTGSIVDNASILTDAEESSINEQITSIEAATGHDVAVLTVLDMGGSSIEDYSIAVARNWELGSAEDNDGVLLVIAMEERELRLEVGTGLEDIITDNDSSNIIDNIVSPHLSDKDYAGGITAGLTELSNVLNGSATPTTVQNSDGTEGSAGFWTTLITSIFIGVVVIVVIIVVMLWIRRKKAEARAEVERAAYRERIEALRKERQEQHNREKAAYNKQREEERQANIKRERELQAFYLTPEGQVVKAELDRKKLEEQKKQEEEKARNRAAREEAARIAAETKAESKKFFDGLDKETLRRIKNTGSKRTRESMLSAELDKARESGSVSSTVDSSSVLATVLLYSAFTSSSSSSSSYSSDSSSSSRSSYDSGSSSHSSSFSSYDSGGSFSGGGDSGSF